MPKGERSICGGGVVADTPLALASFRCGSIPLQESVKSRIAGSIPARRVVRQTVSG